jgi:hypothetical protein
VTRSAKRTLWLALVLGLLAGCSCENGNGERDADTGGDADGDADSDGDSDGDSDVDSDCDADAENSELPCDCEPSVWSWHPYECPEYEPPNDCCSSCRPLTCRELATWRYDIWENFVAYNVRTDVAVVDLNTGRDELVFLNPEGMRGSYLHPAIGSRYVVAQKIRYEGDESRHEVVARPISDFTAPELVLSTGVFQGELNGLDVYDEWACWGRRNLENDRFELVLFNIDSGAHRVLDGGEECDLLYARVWGDRVIWGDWCGRIHQQIISTGETRVVINDPALEYISLLSLWDHYAVFVSKWTTEPDTVMLVDLDTGEMRAISDPETDQTNAWIHNGRVVWADAGRGNCVRVYSLETDQTYIVNPTSDGAGEPIIYDRTLVWGARPVSEVPETIWVTRIADI